MNPRKPLLLALGLLLGLPAAASPAAAQKQPSPAAPASASASVSASAAAKAPIFDSDAIGSRQIADYQKVALDSGRRLVVIFGTNECAACRAFNRALHEKVFFKAFLGQFVPVYVDVSSGTNATLMADYNVNPAAEQPGIVILMPDARIMEVLAQGEMAALARKSDAAVQEYFLSRFAKTEK